MSTWKELRPRLLPPMIAMFMLLQILFLANMCYLYATQFRISTRYHNFNVLYVDYDQGVIGKSIFDAYLGLRGDSFPTFQPASTTEYPQITDIREAVCRGDYWGAVYSHLGASEGLTSAFLNDSKPPTSFTYIWNGVRYPVFSQAGIYYNFQRLILASRGSYYRINGSSVAASANLSRPTTFQTFINPIRVEEINIKGTEHGARVFYNTISTAMPIIQQFFFVLALNGISTHFGAFVQSSWKTNGLIRLVASVLYDFIGGLLMTGYIWAYREDWHLSGSRFAFTWLILWFLMHIHFLVFDITTAFIPIQFMPFVVLTWVILNVASTISPFELSPAFFRWGYALPSHEAYQVLVQVWSGGCNNRLYQALPIMFAWWVVGFPLAVYGMQYRCKEAVKAQRMTENAQLKHLSENQGMTGNSIRIKRQST
jgi:uncharacterized membrane-anchored protein